jgi:hypothetical protein
MTPLQLQMMLHYYTRAEPYAYREPEHATSGAVRDQRQLLENDGLIEPSETSGSGYCVTPRGSAFIEALCETPLPICMWIIPRRAA